VNVHETSTPAQPNRRLDLEIIAENAVYQNRLYRRSPIDAGIPIEVKSREGSTDYTSQAHHAILTLKLHRYEIQALACASTLGNPLLNRNPSLDQPLGMRPTFDLELMREWIRTRLTLKRESNSSSSKRNKMHSDGRSSSVEWKLNVDRTLCKEVRRLPPHNTLMILHAVRIPNVYHDHDDDYGMSSSSSKKKTKKTITHPKGYSARNGRNGGFVIIGHNPLTGEEMSIVPDMNVLLSATKGDTFDSLKYLSMGGDRSFHMRRCAVKVMNELVLMNRNGRPTLSHIRMRWVIEKMERDHAAHLLELAFREKSRRDRALRIALSALCQRTFLVVFVCVRRKAKREDCYFLTTKFIISCRPFHVLTDSVFFFFLRFFIWFIHSFYNLLFHSIPFYSILNTNRCTITSIQNVDIVTSKRIAPERIANSFS
jgi:hypothetical protein